MSVKESSAMNQFKNSSKFQKVPCTFIKSEKEIKGYENSPNKSEEKSISLDDSKEIEKDKLFEIKMDMCIKNIQLKIDLRNSKIVNKKKKMDKKMNQFFVRILLDVDKSIKQILEISEESIYKDHFQNIFDFEKESLTMKGSYKYYFKIYANF